MCSIVDQNSAVYTLYVRKYVTLGNGCDYILQQGWVLYWSSLIANGMPLTNLSERLETQAISAFTDVWARLLRAAPVEIGNLDEVFVRKPWPWTYSHGVEIVRVAWPSAPENRGPVDWLAHGTNLVNKALGMLWESNIADDVARPKDLTPGNRMWITTLGALLPELCNDLVRLPTPDKLVYGFALIGAGYGAYIPPQQCSLCYRLAAPHPPRRHRRKLSAYCEDHRILGESGRQDTARERAKRARAWIAKHYPGWMPKPLTQLDNIRMPVAIVHGRTHNLDLSEVRSALEISPRAADVVGHLPLDPQAALARLRARLDLHEWSWDPARWILKIYRADVWFEALEATSKVDLGGSHRAWARTHELVKLAAQELAKGKSTTDVAERLGKSPSTIRMWRNRHPKLFRS